MRDDPIVEEIRRIRQQHTDKFRGDLRAICDDLRRQEQQSDRRFVLRPARHPQAAATTAPSADNEGQ
jgi:hypothetical protein